MNEIRTHNPAIIAAVLMPNEMLLVLPKVINNASNLNKENRKCKRVLENLLLISSRFTIFFSVFRNLTMSLRISIIDRESFSCGAPASRIS